MSQGKIIKVSGPLVVADGLADANMADVVRVGEQRLIGEILNMTGDQASIQVYEETSGRWRRSSRRSVPTWPAAWRSPPSPVRRSGHTPPWPR